jgi:phosphohistidine phosphatase SixA
MLLGQAWRDVCLQRWLCDVVDHQQAGLLSAGHNWAMKDKFSRRDANFLLLSALGLAGSLQAQTLSTPLVAQDWQALKAPGSIVLFRHALAPGGGDPPGFKLSDCSTQRNLSEEGRAQASRMGEALRQQGIAVQAIWHSQWCRTTDTAQLASQALGRVDLRPEPAFNSFFNDRAQEARQTAAARKLLLGWRGPGVLLVVTHQVNITALTGIVPASGQGVIVQLKNKGREKELSVAGSITP